MVQDVESQDFDAENLGPTLAALRLASGLTQRQLADRCGVHQTMLARYEQSKVKPSRRNLLRALQALGVTLTELYELRTFFGLMAARRAGARNFDSTTVFLGPFRGGDSDDGFDEAGFLLARAMRLIVSRSREDQPADEPAASAD